MKKRKILLLVVLFTYILASCNYDEGNYVELNEAQIANAKTSLLAAKK